MAAWLTGYTRRRMLTIDRTRIDADLVNFPVLLRLTAARHNFALGNANGFDTRITAADGTTLLNFERERHDSGASLAEYHFRVPTVSSAVNTICYFYYRTDSIADGANPTAVWDTNTMARWSLSENPAGTAPQMRDSTVNANHGTTHGAMTPAQSVEGRIARALNFDGVDDFVDAGAGASLNITAAITLEMWINTPQPTKDHQMIATRSNGTAFSQYEFAFFGTTRRLGFASMIGGAHAWHSANTVLSANTWHHAVVTFNGATVRFFLNGIADGFHNRSGTMNSQVQPVQIGARNDGVTTFRFNGLIDEALISNIARSPAWIRASFHSGNDTLLTVGAEETSAPPPIEIENIGVQDIGSAEPPMDSESVGVQDIGGIGVAEEVGVEDIGGIGIADDVGVQDIGFAEPPMDSESVGVQDIGDIGIADDVGIQDIGRVEVVQEIGLASPPMERVIGSVAPYNVIADWSPIQAEVEDVAGFAVLGFYSDTGAHSKELNSFFTTGDFIPDTIFKLTTGDVITNIEIIATAKDFNRYSLMS
ncbi:MAG: hypothetical protein DDT29_01216 [Dehalococcoidia bacterium]|nr:hypothetical protein [Bacillota bacterium]